MLTYMPSVVISALRAFIELKEFTKALDIIALRRFLPAAEKEELLVHILAESGQDARTYNFLSELYRQQNRKNDLRDLGNQARQRGLGYVYNGDLTSAAAFFSKVRMSFPNEIAPYEELYNALDSMITEANQSPAAHAKEEKDVIIAITLWGDTYCDLFLKYFIPTMLAPGNIPNLAKTREVILDLYINDSLHQKLVSADPFLALKAACSVNLRTFPDTIVHNNEMQRDPNLRYYVYGGFHHVSLYRARAMDAYVICIAPDGIHSDGSFSSYINFLDLGHKVVLFTSTRGQAETLIPILDEIRDKSGGVIALLPEKIVDLSTRHIHQEFLQYMMTTENHNFPDVFSRWFWLTKHGFVSRNFHLHPIAISPDTLKGDINFCFLTVDDTLVERILPHSDQWDDIKIIQDSNDGVMLDLTFAFPFEYQATLKERDCSKEYLRQQFENFSAFKVWQFSHKVSYYGTEEHEEFQVFNINEDGEFSPQAISVHTNIQIHQNTLQIWINDAMQKSYPN